jgi:hypothetical protein
MKQLLNLEEQKALIFAIRSRGWNTFANDAATRRAIDSLEAKKLVTVSRETNQFRVVSH